jgi:AraC-like DNA-binding protein
VGTPSSGSCQAARTPRLIRQSDSEQYRVDVLVRGHMVVEQAGRQATLRPGDFTIVDLSRPVRWATAAERVVSLTFPHALLPLSRDQVAQLSGARIPGDHGAGALVAPSTRQVVAHLDDYGAAGVAGWIRRRRLERCRRDLLDPALRAQPVGVIAARWGLTEPAHFSRLFRAAYGVPPVAYRRMMDNMLG